MLFKLGSPSSRWPPCLLRTPRLPDFLISPRTLQSTVFTAGMPSTRIGGGIVYAIEDFRSWAARGRQKVNVRPPAGGTIPPAEANGCRRAVRTGSGGHRAPLA